MKFLDHIEEWLITSLIGTATVVTFVAVVHRYASGLAIPGLQDWLLSINLSWAQELTIILFVWMAKFGAAYGVRTGIHVGVDVLINKLPPQGRAKLILFGLFAGALFTGIVATLGGRFVWENGAHYAFFNLAGLTLDDVLEGPTTPDLEWPTWMVYSAIPLGSSLMCFRFLQVAAGFWRTGELPHHDHGHVDGLEEAGPGAQFDGFALEDNLHPHDLKQDAAAMGRTGGKNAGETK
ncbi:TRAP transporter small permease [Azoarcus sp. KH32C]|uniref:TRAP transporter small permease n=1 Tax=Azoarcus sp. KH32C TaxID=748247 RepID=UPI0002386722|nr:TRAP transporter small permease [Azoarcus sp. KH32C]BAL24232.1 C4-dicarboxylate transport system permease, small subunit [Azoarcus sp. KH32C]